MVRIFVWVALALFLAAPATAADWLRFCRTGDTVTGLSPGEWACNQPTAITEDSGTLNVAMCENIDILHHLDVDGDTSASSTTVQMRSCPNSTASTASCWVAENLTFDGNPATNTEAIYGLKALWIYADLQGDGVIEDPQISVICNLPKQ